MPRNTGKYSKWQLDYARSRVKSHARPRPKVTYDWSGKPFMDPHFDARRKYNYMPPFLSHGATKHLKSQPYVDFRKYMRSPSGRKTFRWDGPFRQAFRHKLNHRRWYEEDLLFNHQQLQDEFDNQWPPQHIADADIEWDEGQIPDFL